MSSFPKFGSIGGTDFSTAEAISTIEVFNYLLAEIPRFLEIFLKFCHIDSVEIGSNFVYASCYILRIYFGGSEITTCLINNQTYYTTKKSILSIEKRQWKLSTIKCRSPYTGCGQLTQCPNFRSLFTTKVT